MKSTSLSQVVFCVVLLCVPCVFASWSNPVLLSELNDSLNSKNAYAPNLSSDGKTMFLSRISAGGQRQIVEAYRDSSSGAFTSERVLTELGTRNISGPWVSAGGLRMYHTRYDGGYASYQLRMAYRESASDAWTASHSQVPGTVFGDIHADYKNDADPTLTPDELTMFFRSNRNDGTYGIWMATRSSITDTSGNYVEFSSPVEITELNAGSCWSPCILPDGLTIYFSSIRDGFDTYDIYKAVRASISDSFGSIERLSISTDLFNERDVYVTPDESQIYFRDESGIWYSQNSLNGIISRIQQAMLHDQTALDEISKSLEAKYIAMQKMEEMLQTIDNNSGIGKSELSASKAKLKAVINYEESAQNNLIKSIEGMEQILDLLMQTD